MSLPSRLGKYRILTDLGGGAMGRVYLAVDEDLDRRVAIKTIHEHLLGTESRQVLLERFRNEARGAARCLHPNIVTVFDFGTHRDAPYIVMEYVEGRELSDYLRERLRFPPKQSVELVLQVLAGLEYAHSHGIVHRDIKPSNLFVMPNGTVKLGDFGIARVDNASLTREGASVGTPHYMSPEQFKGETVDARSDLFSVALILYELLTGERAFSADSVSATMKRVLLDMPLPMRTFNRDLPVELDIAVARGLSEDPARRYQSAAAFADTLRSALGLDNAEVGDETPTRAIASQDLTRYLARAEQTLAVTDRPTSRDPDWTAEDLARLEHDLTRDIGPVAKILVKRAARSARTLEELMNSLATDTRDPEMISKLRGRLTHTTEAGRSTTRGGMADPGGPFGPGQLKQIESQLTLVMGPIASILVRNAMKGAGSPQELVLRLADAIPTAVEREEFLRHCASL